MSHKRREILLIEDNPGDVRLIREMLAEVPGVSWELESTGRLSTGLKYLDKQQPDIILLDLGLPDSQGLETLGKICSKTTTVPIVVLTGLNDEAIANQAVHNGAQDYLLKGDINGRALWRVIRYAIERKRAEETLLEAKEFSESLIASARDGITVLDNRGVHIDVNNAICEMTGFLREELIGAGLPHPYWPPERYEEIDRAFQRTMAGDFTDIELTFMRKNGERFPVIVSPASIKDQQGNVISYFATVKDITERKRIEEELIKSESKYRSLVETAGAGVVSGDLQGNITFVNETFCQMLGYSLEEMVGKPFVDFVNPDDKAWVWDRFLLGLAHPELEHHVEFRVIHKKGHSLWLSSNPTPIFHKGELIGGNAIIHDITSRKQSEEALKESEEKYRLLAENASDIIWTIDMNLRFTYMSPSIERIRGYTVEEVMDQSLEEVFTPSSVETVVKAFTEELAIESLETKDLSRARTLELELTCKDSSTVWCEVKASFIRDADGQPVGIIGVAREITERREAEEALRQSEERYRTILDDMEESYYETDLTGNFTIVNDALCRHLGYSREEMMGMNYLAYTPPEDVKRVSQSSNQVYRTGKPVKFFPREMIRKDGSRTFTESSIFPLRNESGKIIGWRGVGRDVTERKKAEEILRESEDRYRDLVDHSNDLICTHDLDGRILSANPLASRVLGYSLDSILQKNVRDFLLPEFRKGFDAYLAEIQKQGAVEGLLTVQTATGERRIWEFNNTLRIEGVAAPVVRGMARDITERKLAEQALRESEEKYRTLFDSTADGILIADLETRQFQYANPAICRMLGYTEEELRTMDVAAIHPKEDLPRVLAEFEAQARGDKTLAPELPCLRKDGTIVYADINAVSITVDGRKCNAGFFRDITQRKKADEDIRIKDKTIHSSINATALGDLEGNLMYVNPAFLEMWGYNKNEEVLGKPTVGFWQEQDKVKEIIEALQSKGGWRGELIAKRKDDSYFDVQLSANMVFDETGKPICMSASFIDITKRKKAEQQALVNAKLASVGELVAGVAHEINNPLTGIIGYAQLLAESQNVPQNVKEDLQKIYEESQRTVKIVKNLLGFARQYKPEKNLVDINELLERTLELEAYKMRTSNIELSTKLAADIPLMLADYNQLQQVILNIITNAQHAIADTRRKGKITVTTDNIEDCVRISIADNGTGISPENMTKIFDPFFTTKPEGSGSGLGLSVCHGIITEHGGNIYAESTPDKGTTFIIELPVATGEQAVIKEKEPARKKSRRPRRKMTGNILIAEDEPSIRAVLTRTLSANGYQVQTVSDGKAALGKLAKNVYDLIFTDLKMPGMSGRELYQVIKKKHPNSAEKVVFITGDVMTGDTHAFLASTGRPYLVKPFYSNDVTDIIEKVLGS
jgi:PAS domain S-box-containing protein